MRVIDLIPAEASAAESLVKPPPGTATSKRPPIGFTSAARKGGAVSSQYGSYFGAINRLKPDQTRQSADVADLAVTEIGRRRLVTTIHIDLVLYAKAPGGHQIVAQTCRNV
mgnify:CR=1 FL=1